MKATGMIRRVDDLGRIVVPKEIRRNLNIHEGDPLEIYTTDDKGIMLRKYDLAANVAEAVQDLKVQITDNPSLPCRPALMKKLAELEVLLSTDQAAADNREG